MAITTYAQLKTAVANWMKRTDLDAVIPDFIGLGENRISKELDPRLFELEVTLTATPGSRYISLPSDYNSPIGLWLTAYLPREELTQMVPSAMPVRTNANSLPTYWAIDGANIAFDVPASYAYTVTFRYKQNLDLSDTQTSNAVLVAHPELYLWAALVEAWNYVQSPQNAAIYEQRFMQALESAANYENRGRDVRLQTDANMTANRLRFDINRGY